MSIKVALSHITNFDIDNDPYSASAFPIGDITNISSYVNSSGRIKFRFGDDFDFIRSYPQSGVYSARIEETGLEVEEFLEPTVVDNKNIYWSYLLGNVYVSQIFEVEFTEFTKPSYLVPSDPYVAVSEYLAKCDIAFYKLVCNQTTKNKSNTRARYIFVTSNVENPTPGKYKVQLTRSQKVNYTMDSVNLLERLDE